MNKVQNTSLIQRSISKLAVSMNCFIVLKKNFVNYLLMSFEIDVLNPAICALMPQLMPFCLFTYRL